MWHYGIWIHSPHISVGVVHSTWPFWAMWHMHAPTFNKWQKKNKKVTIHILTHGAMQGCGLTSLVACINDKIHDIREINVTLRSDTWIPNICSLGFWDIREWVILWSLILWSLGFTTIRSTKHLWTPQFTYHCKWIVSTPMDPITVHFFFLCIVENYLVWAHGYESTLNVPKVSCINKINNKVRSARFL